MKEQIADDPESLREAVRQNAAVFDQLLDKEDYKRISCDLIYRRGGTLERTRCGVLTPPTAWDVHMLLCHGGETIGNDPCATAVRQITRALKRR